LVAGFAVNCAIVFGLYFAPPLQFGAGETLIVPLLAGLTAVVSVKQPAKRAVRLFAPSIVTVNGLLRMS
jgi:hypothetical protein